MSEADLTAELNFDKKKKKKKPMKLDDDEMASLEQRKSKIWAIFSGESFGHISSSVKDNLDLSLYFGLGLRNQQRAEKWMPMEACSKHMACLRIL